MKNIAYIMQVEWNWIKQRPHFIAEELHKNNKIMAYYRYCYNRTPMQKRDTGGMNVKPIYVFPLIGRIKEFLPINVKIRNRAIKKYIEKQKPDIIYITHPDQIGAIPDNFKGKMIYDCMDNHTAFATSKKEEQRVFADEQKLLNISNHILVSSIRLQENLEERYGDYIKDKITLVRNGFNGEIIQPCKTQKKEWFDICYFGTISSWFNFEYVTKALDEFNNIRFFLYGPADVDIPKQYDRLVYKGIIEHDKLYENVKDMDCLIMPFIVNELIKSVDPVKLYEYINFDKHIICCDYPEVRRFENFVDFYSDYNSFVQTIKDVMSRQEVKYSNEERVSFLKNNSWANRAEQIEQIMEDL